MLDLLLTAAALGGLLIAVRPVLDDAHATSEARDVITSMTVKTNETDNPQRVEDLHQAQSFNAALAAHEYTVDNSGLGGSNGGDGDILDVYSKDADSEVIPYEQQLLWNGYPAMCWIEIPAINVREPVYHGTSDDALSQGVGHLDWSSLPVGGTPSHCVLAAHSGMQETRMFDDLDKLEKGDVFVIHTLGDAYQYEVYDIEVVKPQEAKSKCELEPEKDVCTLVTCTPYGINTHRLLVHAMRVAYTQAQVEEARPSLVPKLSSSVKDRRAQPALLACASLGIPLVLHVVSLLCRRRFGSHRATKNSPRRVAYPHTKPARKRAYAVLRGADR